MLESSAEALLQLAGDFSPRYEMVRPHLVVVDIGGLGRLLGTPREIGEAFCRIARERGLIVAVGIASTQTAALLLALHQARSLARHPHPTRQWSPWSPRNLRMRGRVPGVQVRTVNVSRRNRGRRRIRSRMHMHMRIA